jgi:hypothetical protein
MKHNRYFTVIGLLLFLILCFVPGGQAQLATPISQTPGTPWQFGLSWTFSSGSAPTDAFNVKGLSYYRILFVPSGTVSACGLSLDSSATGAGFSTGGILSSVTIGSCSAAGMYVTTTAAGVTNFGRITPTVTGSGSVTVVLFGYTDNPAAGGSIGGSVAVTNFPSSQTVNGTVSTQPSGFGSVLSGQQTVTASPVALPTNAVHGACVKALAGNTINVYVGPAGVTIATGFELAPDESVCYQVSNTNLFSVIASSTGASVSWTAQ